MGQPKKRKRWILLVVILAAVAVAVVLLVRSISAKAQKAMTELAGAELTYTVARGTLEKTITATGVLSAVDTELVKLPNGILVDKVLVTVGEAVTAGQPLARLNAASVGEQLAYVQKKVGEADNRLATAGTDDSIKAPAKGRVKYQPVVEGDDVLTAMQQYGALAILSTDGFMRLAVDTDRTFPLGARREVVWDGGRAFATIDRKTDTGYIVLVPDSHAPYLGKATLMDGDVEAGSGTLEINMPAEVVASDGVIRTVRYHLDESVPDGREMYSLKNPGVSNAFATQYATRSKLLNLYQRTIALSTNPVVVAPCDGVVSEISLKEGETVGKVANADADSLAFTLGIHGAGKLTVNIDELDILSVVLDQEAKVKLDAMPNEALTAKVARIGIVGKKENSISTFPVELTLPDDARLMAGMNGTATILVERAENVLLIPLDAIEEDADGEYVYVLSPSGEKVRTVITTGRSDSEQAEVTAGLSEGDVLSYAPSSGGAVGMAGAMSTVTVAG